MTSIGHELDESRRSRTRKRAVDYYNSLEKQLLNQTYAEQLAEVGKSFNPGGHTYYNIASGWMLAESALINTSISTSERLELIDLAQQRWDRALETKSSKSSSSELYSYGLIDADEIKISATLAAGKVFRDIVSGDLTLNTRNQYYEDLLYLGVKAAELFEFYSYEVEGASRRVSKSGVYIGMANEMNAMLILARLRSTSLVCTRSLLRADSGSHYPRQTHDLQVLNTKWGELKNIQGIEVKTTPKDEHYERYDAVLIGGTVHLHPNHLRDPSCLTELLVKEHKGKATEEELNTINTITNNVVHSVRHGFRGIPQCREIKDCQEITD